MEPSSVSSIIDESKATDPRPVINAKVAQYSDPEIPRDSIINLIDDFFKSGTSIVSLEGRSDIGKTVVLRQFCEIHAGHCLSVFLQPNSWYLHDPSLFYAELAAQMSAALNISEPHSAFNGVDESTVRKMLFAISREWRKRNELFYFVVDGIEDVVQSASPLMSALIGVLPFELPSFRYAFSGDLGWLPKHVLSSLRTVLMPFRALQKRRRLGTCPSIG